MSIDLTTHRRMPRDDLMPSSELCVPTVLRVGRPSRLAARLGQVRYTGSTLHRSKALQVIDDRRGSGCVCDKHPQCCQDRDGVLHLNTGTLKPSGGRRIGKSCSFKAVSARRHDFEISESSAVVQPARFIELCRMGRPFDRESALMLIALKLDALSIVADSSSLVDSSAGFSICFSSIKWI